jgi:hypothetical protein
MLYAPFSCIKFQRHIAVNCKEIFGNIRRRALYDVKGATGPLKYLGQITGEVLAREEEISRSLPLSAADSLEWSAKLNTRLRTIEAKYAVQLMLF